MIQRNSLNWFVGLAALAGAASAASAGVICVPPQNEICDDAISFTNADLPLSLTAPLGCVNDVVDKPYFDVFYRFDCTQTGMYLIHMCGSSGDTSLRIYGDGCGWGDGFELAIAEDECPGSPPGADPLLLVSLEAGNSYWLELGTWRPDAPWAPPPNSPYFLHVSFETEPPGPAGSLDVDAGPLEQLQIAKDGHGLELSWGDSCILDDTDYAIYEGQLGLPGDHVPIVCSTAGATSYVASTPAGDAYFLVTAQNSIVGGSYGKTSTGAQRPKGSPPCLPRLIGTCP